MHEPHHSGSTGLRVLLTGATGFVGAHLAAALTSRGDEVVAVSRRGPVRWEDVEGQVGRADAVVHLAGEPIADGRWTPERLERIRSSRVDTTARIARAIAGAGRKPRVLVSASAVGIYGTRRDDVVCDEATPRGDDPLARIVEAWEAAAEPARAAAVRVAHPRLGIVLGKGGALAKMSGPFRWFVGGPLGTGDQWLAWVHIHDVVRALLFAIDHEELVGPFNVVAPEPVTMGTFAGALGHALGRPSMFKVPAFALRAALGDGLAEVLLTGQRAVPRRLTAAGFTFEHPGLDEALRDVLVQS